MPVIGRFMAVDNKGGVCLASASFDLDIAQAAGA